jgi:cytochrome c2
MQRFFFFLLFSLITTAHAAEPSLFIKYDGKEIVYTRSELLKRADLVAVTTKDDPVFPGKTMTYKAVQAAALFKGLNVPADATIHFQALDGFSAPIARELLLNANNNAAIAYIAIELPEHKWPAMKPEKSPLSAAPYYLIWKNPQKSRINTELWVTQLSGFTIEASFATLFPHVAPDAKLPANDPVMLGFKVFKANCFSCHTINREGNSHIGPDLNVPHNPTEYFVESYMRKFIRDPRSLREWKNERMSAFSEKDISDKELEYLIGYLKYMKGRKI